MQESAVVGATHIPGFEPVQPVAEGLYARAVIRILQPAIRTRDLEKNKAHTLPSAAAKSSSVILLIYILLTLPFLSPQTFLAVP